MNKLKKILMIIMVVIIISAFLTLGYFTFKYYKAYKKYENEKLEEVRIYEENLAKEEEIRINKEKEENERRQFLEENVYNNTIPIGIYTIQNGRKVLTREFYCDWSRDSIFALFYAIASNEEELPNTNFENQFKEYWEKNEMASSYKIGYNIKYTLDTGEVIDKRILCPDDTESLFANLQFYLYDDVTYMPGRRYYHMRQYEVTDATIYTSVKIVGYKETKGVNGPIELTVFTYDGDEDFDKETGKYLGNSKFTTKIYREKV